MVLLQGIAPISSKVGVWIVLARRQFYKSPLCTRLDVAVRIMANDFLEERLCVFGVETFGLILDGFVFLAPQLRVRRDNVPDLFVQRGREGIPVTGQFPQKDGCRLSSGGIAGRRHLRLEELWPTNHSGTADREPCS